MRVTLIGIGCGNEGTMTVEAVKTLKNADLMIGAERLLDGVSTEYAAKRKVAVNGKEIFKLIVNEDMENICVLYSGDSGFYSGTRRLVPLLEEAGIDFDVIPGVSSVQYFAAKIQRPWHDWNLFSAHGVGLNAVNAVMEGKPAFFLTGGALGPAELCGQLTDAGLGHIEVIVGENLSYEAERIFRGTASEAAQMKFEKLSVMLAESCETSGRLPERRTPGIPDDKFIRGGVPMTKQDVRAVIMGKLAVREDDVLWDVGAGTGSVSVEMALSAVRGKVFAVECGQEGCRLIEENRKALGAWNIYGVHGMAPEALNELPAPDAVFIGGTKGRMKEIVAAIHGKNPTARICISAIALETLTAATEALALCGYDVDVTQISVSNTRKAGSLHMLMANNPIFLITGRKQ